MSKQVIDNIDDILSVEGLGGIFIRPMDLAISLGYFSNPSHPEVQQAIAKVEKKTLKAGKYLGTIGGSWELAKGKFERGYQFLMLKIDTVDLAKHSDQTLA